MTDPLPIDVREAAIRVCGTAFLYKDPLRSVFVSAGVSGQDFDRLRDQDLSKYVIARQIFKDLDGAGERGRRLQHAIVRQLAGVHEPMPDAVNPQAGSAALAQLRTTLGRNAGRAAESDGQMAARRKQKELRDAALQANRTRIEQIRHRFYELSHPAPGLTPNRRGYAFEALLEDLFRAHEISYRPPYRIKNIEQIDGAFKLNGRDYLVEARWRSDAPTLGDLLTFAGKVDRKAHATRGFFITMVPPHTDSIIELKRHTMKVLIMDGRDLAAIVDGIYSLRDALAMKEDRAAQVGAIFSQLGAVAA